MTLFPLSAEMLNLWKGIIGQLLLIHFFAAVDIENIPFILCTFKCTDL